MPAVCAAVTVIRTRND